MYVSISGDPSFPSDHATVAFAIACSVPLFATCPKEVSNVQSAEILNSTPGMLSVGHTSRHLTAEWWKSVWHANDFIEAATSPDVYTSGPLEGLFRDENLVLYDDTLSQDQRTFSSREPLPPGTYWVHVATEDVSGCCGTDITAPLTVAIPSNPPVLHAATHSGRFLHADWSLPPDMESDFVEVASSPAVYPAGPLAGFFLDQNLVLSTICWPRPRPPGMRVARLPTASTTCTSAGSRAAPVPRLMRSPAWTSSRRSLPVRIGAPSPPAGSRRGRARHRDRVRVAVGPAPHVRPTPASCAR